VVFVGVASCRRDPTKGSWGWDEEGMQMEDEELLGRYSREGCGTRISAHE
jgi:hypothetical protein